ncbi:DUF4097 family beta strand repeat-containing protein [Clostridium sp. C8-1-8]|uniref:DUF4097 family beta strand repeat-containing protein n=1 Tax=Clostridium sp. C8-1-8 TaxID=2698831 RepID=UPI00136D3203|nr:DUF4097 family beta strand repeat-containing protein [Clostridium sp. C8-1-8]
MKNNFMKRLCLILAAVVLICYGSAAIILKVTNFNILNVINDTNSFISNKHIVERHSSTVQFNDNNNSSSSSNNKGDYNLNDEVDKSLSGINNIDLSFVSSDLTFHDYDKNEIKVVLTGNLKTSFATTAPKLEGSTDGDTVKVSLENKSFLGIGSYSLNSKIDIYMPKDYSKNLSVSTVSSEINLSDKQLNNLHLNSTSGNIKLSNIKVDSLNAKTVSGDITGSSVITNKTETQTVSGKVLLDKFEGVSSSSSVSGDISFNYQNVIGDISAHSTSGDIILKLPKDCSFNLDASSTSGDMSTKFSLENSSSGKRSLSGTYGNGNNKLSLHTTSGDINVDKN